METVLRFVNKIVPLEKLRKMRRLREIKPFLPAKVNGLTVRNYTPKRAQDLVELNKRTQLVQNVVNTPAMGVIGKRYSPFALQRLVKERLDEYEKENGPIPPEIKEFEGIDENNNLTFLSKNAWGHTNWAQLLDQVLTMGPDVPEKRGASPVHPYVADAAIDKTVSQLSKFGVSQLKFGHVVPCTEDSTGDGCPTYSLGDKAAATPWIYRPATQDKPTAHKRHWLAEATKLTHLFLDRTSRSQHQFRGVVYKRFDRKGPMAGYADTESAKDQIVLNAKDRAIIAQPFSSQLAEMAMLRPLQVGIQQSDFPDIDMRTPYHTSQWMASLNTWVQTPGTARYTIGVDESGWDHHVNPQGWYAFYSIAKRLFRPTQRIGTIECDEHVIFDKQTQSRLESIKPGNSADITVRVRVRVSKREVREETRVAKATMFEISTEQALKRLFASISGNPILIGDVEVSGFKHVYQSEREGTLQLGWGQRSGNWSTFLGNNIINLWKWNALEIGCGHEPTRAAFKEFAGYDLPLKLKIIKLARGDDLALGIEIVDDDFNSQVEDGTRKISALCADWISFTGGLANADKQETSDTRNVFELGFAQTLGTSQFPRTITSFSNAMQKTMYREEDEATGIDPLTGRDLRVLITDMGNFARFSNLFGGFGRDIHPLAEVAMGIWQDLDVPGKSKEDGSHLTNRLMPPADKETRDALSRLYYARMARRGQAPPGSMAYYNLWNTPMGDAIETRFRANPKLESQWTPLGSNPPVDARDSWRARIKG